MDYRKDEQKEAEKKALLEKYRILAGIKKRSILNLAATQEGRLFLYFMMCDCGFYKSSLAYDDKKNIAHDAVVYNEALRNYYIGVRQFIPKDLLKDIEFLDIEKHVQEQIKKGEQS